MNRLLVTGSRTWTDVSFVRETLYAAFHARPDKTTGLVVVHGACSDGLDHLADRYVRDFPLPRMVRAERHPAQWRIHGKAAGPIRNQKMVDRGAYLCLAFVMPCTSLTCPRPEPHDSHGAADCAQRAQAAGIPTVIYRPPLGGVA